LIVAVVAGFSLLPERVKLIDWQHYEPAAIDKAIENNQPVLIKFTADWCTTCSFVEKRVFQKKDVAQLFEQKGVVVFKGDTTSKDSVDTIDLSQKYNEPGVPVTLVFTPDGKRHTLRGLIGKKDLTEIIKKLPDVRK